mmetsp:Transcript_14965/g.50464  ORF Transcript_14965/g.50464 Transcript_14965/m.50464 type:complete len:293 (-) Transcript_14965:885-1763(-)
MGVASIGWDRVVRTARAAATARGWIRRGPRRKGARARASAPLEGRGAPRISLAAGWARRALRQAPGRCAPRVHGMGRGRRLGPRAGLYHGRGGHARELGQWGPRGGAALLGLGPVLVARGGDHVAARRGRAHRRGRRRRRRLPPRPGVARAVGLCNRGLPGAEQAAHKGGAVAQPEARAEEGHEDRERQHPGAPLELDDHLRVLDEEPDGPSGGRCVDHPLGSDGCARAARGRKAQEGQGVAEGVRPGARGVPGGVKVDARGDEEGHVEAHGAHHRHGGGEDARARGGARRP